MPKPTCDDCKVFYGRAQSIEGDVVGQCRLRPELKDIPIDMPSCDSFRIRDDRIGKVDMSSKPRARHARGIRVSRDAEVTAPSRKRPTLETPVTGDTDGEIAMDRDGLKQVLRELLEEESMYGYPEMGARWEGGTMVLNPADSSLQSKELPIDTFFHKIVMIRDRLRVLESKINSSDDLSEQDKVEMQGYISKCYGTLTTFNVLFRHKADQFSSK